MMPPDQVIIQRWSGELDIQLVRTGSIIIPYLHNNRGLQIIMGWDSSRWGQMGKLLSIFKKHHCSRTWYFELLLGKSTRKTRLVQWQIQILPRLKPIFWLPWHHRVVRNRGLYIQCTLQDFQELKTSITLAINSIHTWIFARSYSAKILSTNSYMYGYSTGLFQYFLFGFLTNVILNPSFGTILLRKKSNKQSK